MGVSFFYVCLFSGSFLGVETYEDLHAPNSAKFEKTIGLLARAPQEHMVRGASDIAQFTEAVTEILRTDLPIAWKAERAEYDAIGESDRMTLRFRKPG